MQSIKLRHGRAHARLLPERGALLSELWLWDGVDATRPLLWLPPDFSADASGWPGGGLPLLFPFAGRVFHEGRAFHYGLGDQVLTMPIHGFAYGLPWEVRAQGEDHVTLKLRDSSRTRELYPFAFTLTAHYRLSQSALDLELKARHEPAEQGEGARMPVAMGLHPYWRIPLGKTGPVDADAMRHTYLESSARRKFAVTPEGRAGKDTLFPADASERETRLDQPLLQNLILADHARPVAKLVDQQSGVTLSMDWKTNAIVRYLVLWSKPNEGFYCLEPWMGLPDAIGVADGQGATWLAPGEDTQLSVRFTLARS